MVAGTHAATVMRSPWRYDAPANRSALQETGVYARVGPAWRDSGARRLSSRSYRCQLSRPSFFNRSPILNAHAPAANGFLLYIQSDLVKPITGSTVNVIPADALSAPAARGSAGMTLTHARNLYRRTHYPRVGRPTNGRVYFIVEMKESLLVYL